MDPWRAILVAAILVGGLWVAGRGLAKKNPAFRSFSRAEAKRIGDAIGVNWKRVPLDEFRRGLTVELEHGKHDKQTDVTHDNLIQTGKIALAHLKEDPRYYTKLRRVEGGKR